MTIHRIVVQIGCVLALSLTLACSASDNKPMLDLYIVAGQSNAEGRKGDAEKYPHRAAADTQIRFFWVNQADKIPQGTWGPLGPQAGYFPKGHFGPEVSMAHAAFAQNHNIAVFKFARNSTSLSHDWLPESDHGLFATFSRVLDRAIDTLQTTHTVAPTCFVWIQGETDSRTAQSSKDYAHHLRALVEASRKMLGAGVRIVLGLNDNHHWVLQFPAVLEAQKNMAAADPDIRFVSTVGLPSEDGAHLTPAGVITHGQRIYEACAS